MLEATNEGVVLDREKYGFEGSRLVRVVRPELLEFGLSPQVENIFYAMLGQDEYPLNEALDIIARSVNDSMAYDTATGITIMLDSAIGLVNLRFRDPDFASNMSLCELIETVIEPITGFAEEVERAGYIARGTEVSYGVCVDAGNRIRTMLRDSLEESNLRYKKVHIRNGYAGIRTAVWDHDMTVVFDVNAGNWVLLNSKSPRLFYNLVPKEKLAELLLPYSTG